jgi:N-acyl amino acid synthase of PEP-CTERM/exosortase system
LDPTPYFTGRRLAYSAGQAELQAAFALRFGVYCQECHFLDPRAYPDGLETDAADAASAHFLAFNQRQELVGYVRLVPPDARGKLPWEAHCTSLCAGIRLPPRAHSAEISRLMVRDDYRRRQGDTLSGVPETDTETAERLDRRAATPQILLTLYRQMYLYSLAHGIQHWYAAMERPLARSLKRLDFAFHQIGAQADYFGPVAPYLADLRELEARLALSQPDLLAWMQSPEEAAP